MTAHGAQEVRCPLCAQTLPQIDFLHTPDFFILVRAAHIATLSPQEATAFQLLLNNRHKHLTHVQLTERVYASNSGPAWAKGSIYCLVRSLRTKLAPLNITVPSMHHCYRMQFK